MPKPSVSMDDLLGLSQTLESDAELPLAEIQERDTGFRNQITDPEMDPVELLITWEAHARSDAPNRSTLKRSLGLGLLLTFVMSFIAGITSGMGLFHYDGTHPINLLPPLATVLLIQVVSIGLLIILLLSRSKDSPHAFLVETSPGRWLPQLLGMLSPAYARDLQSWKSALARHSILFGRVHRWTVIKASQLAGIAFFLGLSLSFLRLVIFTDLSFSWSTTLDLSSDRIHQATSVLAAPAEPLFPSVSPSRELVASTRYFRADQGNFVAQDTTPIETGSWWPFVIFTLLFYGLLPRLILYGIASNRLAACSRETLVSLPGASELLTRLRKPVVDTGNPFPKNTTSQLKDSRNHAATPSTDQSHLLITWNEAIPTVLYGMLNITEGKHLKLGGTQSWQQDLDTIRGLSGKLADANPVIAVKAWEPPVGDFMDLIRELRTKIPKDRMILVAPLKRQGDDGSSLVWARAVETLHDPYIRILNMEGEQS